MNLHGIVKNIVSAVNPLLPLNVQISVGSTTNPDGTRVPAFATPCAFMGSISGSVLNVRTMGSGVIQVGQTLFDEAGDIAPNTVIVNQLNGPSGGPGNYTINNQQNLGLELIQATLTIQGDVQALSYSDIRQVEGLNLQGTRRAIYFDGPVYGLVRPTNQGGDLITLPDGTVWLVAMVTEKWPNWSKAVVTQQNVKPPVLPPNRAAIDG